MASVHELVIENDIGEANGMELNLDPSAEGAGVFAGM